MQKILMIIRCTACTRVIACFSNMTVGRVNTMVNTTVETFKADTLSKKFQLKLKNNFAVHEMGYSQ